MSSMRRMLISFVAVRAGYYAIFLPIREARATQYRPGLTGWIIMLDQLTAM